MRCRPRTRRAKDAAARRSRRFGGNIRAAGQEPIERNGRFDVPAAMSRVRLGAVSYLNARPLVYGLEREPQFDLRYDIPSECAQLLHAKAIDVGLIPSIEYLRGPRPYAVVPGPAVTSRGRVASVAVYTRGDPKDVRSIAMDTSSRTSVALATITFRRQFGATVQAIPMAPDLEAMLATADAALIIGDAALFLDHEQAGVQKIDLGELWTSSTGLPFVYAIWVGWPGAVQQRGGRAPAARPRCRRRGSVWGGRRLLSGRPGPAGGGGTLSAR